MNVAAPQPVTNRACSAASSGAPPCGSPPAAVLRLIAGSERAAEALLSSAKAVPEALLRSGFVFGDPELKPALRRMLGVEEVRTTRSARVPTR